MLRASSTIGSVSRGRMANVLARRASKLEITVCGESSASASPHLAKNSFGVLSVAETSEISHSIVGPDEIASQRLLGECEINSIGGRRRFPKAGGSTSRQRSEIS